jgi:ectoine hydroxylase-related dioxygenase (phytanoyl-CoA dioxygenase family)
MENPLFEEIVADYLDEDHPLAAIYSANIVGPGAEAQFLHQDQSGVKPTPHYAIGVNTLFCLDDFTEDNGATRIVPGSHIAERGLAPDNIYTTKGTVAAVVPAGSAIIFESRLWHGAGASKPGQKNRRSITLLTQRAWTRGATNGVLAVHPEVLATMSDSLKSRMGFRVTDGLGAIQTEPEGTMIGWNPDQLVRELHAESCTA